MVNSRSADNSPWLETEFKSDDDYLTFMDSLGMDVRKDTERRSLNSLQEYVQKIINIYLERDAVASSISISI